MPGYTFGLALLLALALPPGFASAQQAKGDTPQISSRDMAKHYITGRYIAPVRCTREDGSLIDLQEAMTVREDPSTPATTTGAHLLRATFFGIDVSGVTHCHNLMSPRLRDRRGILQLSFRGQTREDLGLTYFKTELRDGEIGYHVRAGRIQAREFGSESEPEVFEFDDDAELFMREVPPRSDAARMLSRFATRTDLRGRLRAYEFELATDQGTFKMWVLKDTRADSKGHRSAGSRR